MYQCAPALLSLSLLTGAAHDSKLHECEASLVCPGVRRAWFEASLLLLRPAPARKCALPCASWPGQVQAPYTEGTPLSAGLKGAEALMACKRCLRRWIAATARAIAAS